MNANLSSISEEDNKTSLTEPVAAGTCRYVRHVDSETEVSDTESSSSSSDSSYIVKRRRHGRRKRNRSLSRKAMRRRHTRGGVNSSPSLSKSRGRYYGATDDEISRSRSRYRSRSGRSVSSSRSRSSSRSTSRSSYSRRKYKSSKKHGSYTKSKGADRKKPLYAPRTPKYWPKNAVNNYSTPYVNNTITHPQLLMSSPRNFSTNDVRMGLRRRLQVFLDDPNSSKYAVAFALFIAFMVMLSSISVIIESLPQFYEHESALWWQFETITLIIFSSELALRCFAHSTSWKQFNRFFWSFSNFIDIVAIAPIFIEAVFMTGRRNDAKRFMVFRLFRLIRLLHCYGYSSVLQLSMDAMFIALKKSKDALLAILFFQFFVIIIFSTLIYFFERGTMINGKFMMDGEPSKFDSIPATFWFVAEVITTVGLGDVYPRTVPGKLLSFPLMLFGLLIIALPSIVLGKNFAEAWLWLKTSGNIQKQAILQAKIQKEQHEKGKKKSNKLLVTKKKQQLKSPEEHAGGNDPIMTAKDFAKEFEGGKGNQNIQSSSELNKHPPEYSTAIDIDRMEKGGNNGLSFVEKEEEEEQKQRENEEANEETNNETVRSGDQTYFVSTEALIESENQSEILQLVQMLVEQFQHNSQVMERLARQQENLVGTVGMLKKTQLRMAKQQGISGITASGNVTSGDEYNLTSDERSISRSRHRSSRSRSRSRNRSSRSRSRNRSRSRSHAHSRSRSKGVRSDSSRGRSRSKSIIRLNRSRSRSPSPRSETPRGRARGSQSRSRTRSRSSSGSRHRHRRRVSSCSTCEDR